MRVVFPAARDAMYTLLNASMNKKWLRVFPPLMTPFYPIYQLWRRVMLPRWWMDERMTLKHHSSVISCRHCFFRAVTDSLFLLCFSVLFFFPPRMTSRSQEGPMAETTHTYGSSSASTTRNCHGNQRWDKSFSRNSGIILYIILFLYPVSSISPADKDDYLKSFSFFCDLSSFLFHLVNSAHTHTHAQTQARVKNFHQQSTSVRMVLLMPLHQSFGNRVFAFLYNII